MEGIDWHFSQWKDVYKESYKVTHEGLWSVKESEQEDSKIWLCLSYPGE